MNNPIPDHDWRLMQHDVALTLSHFTSGWSISLKHLSDGRWHASASKEATVETTQMFAEVTIDPTDLEYEEVGRPYPDPQQALCGLIYELNGAISDEYIRTAPVVMQDGDTVIEGRRIVNLRTDYRGLRTAMFEAVKFCMQGDGGRLLDRNEIVLRWPTELVEQFGTQQGIKFTDRMCGGTLVSDPNMLADHIRIDGPNTTVMVLRVPSEFLQSWHDQ